jgi:Ca-activated chloride channel homolog
VGTAVTPTGAASASGWVGGTGLDLALVLDVSGSMAFDGGGGHTRMYWLQQAAIALVNSLPQASTSVSLIGFDMNTHLYYQLTSLQPVANKNALISQINALTPGSGTAMGDGINAGTAELTSARHTAGRSMMEVVVSDGEWNTGANPIGAAQNAYNQGITVHTVGLLLSGQGAVDMQATANAGHGVYTAFSDLSRLEGIFDGTEGNLVGLDHVTVTDPNGNTTTVPTDGLGNFSAPNWNIELGSQTWTATAYGQDGTSASANLTLQGVPQGVPEGGSSLALLAAAFMGLLGFHRKNRK